MKTKFPPNCRVFIGNLASERTSPQELTSIFGKHGRLAEEPVLRRNFGFIQYWDERCARTAIEKEHGRMIGGSKIETSLADNRPIRKDGGDNRPPRREEGDNKPLRKDGGEEKRERPAKRDRGGEVRGRERRNERVDGKAGDRKSISERHDKDRAAEDRLGSPRRKGNDGLKVEMDSHSQIRQDNIKIQPPDDINDVLVVRVDNPSRGYCLSIEEKVTERRLLYELRDIVLNDLPETLKAAAERSKIKHVMIVGARHESVQTVTIGSRELNGQIEEFREVPVSQALHQLTSSVAGTIPPPPQASSDRSSSVTSRGQPPPISVSHSSSFGFPPDSSRDCRRREDAHFEDDAFSPASRRRTGESDRDHQGVSTPHEPPSNLSPHSFFRSTDTMSDPTSPATSAHLRPGMPTAVTGQHLSTFPPPSRPPPQEHQMPSPQSHPHQPPPSAAPADRSAPPSADVQEMLNKFLHELHSGGGQAALANDSTRQQLLNMLHSNPALVQYLVSKVQPQLSAAATAVGPPESGPPPPDFGRPNPAASAPPPGGAVMQPVQTQQRNPPPRTEPPPAVPAPHGFHTSQTQGAPPLPQPAQMLGQLHQAQPPHHMQQQQQQPQQLQMQQPPHHIPQQQQQQQQQHPQHPQHPQNLHPMHHHPQPPQQQQAPLQMPPQHAQSPSQQAQHNLQPPQQMSMHTLPGPPPPNIQQAPIHQQSRPPNLPQPPPLGGPGMFSGPPPGWNPPGPPPGAPPPQPPLQPPQHQQPGFPPPPHGPGVQQPPQHLHPGQMPPPGAGPPPGGAVPLSGPPPHGGDRFFRPASGGGSEFVDQVPPHRNPAQPEAGFGPPGQLARNPAGIGLRPNGMGMSSMPGASTQAPPPPHHMGGRGSGPGLGEGLGRLDVTVLEDLLLSTAPLLAAAASSHPQTAPPPPWSPTSGAAVATPHGPGPMPHAGEMEPSSLDLLNLLARPMPKTGVPSGGAPPPLPVQPMAAPVGGGGGFGMREPYEPPMAGPDGGGGGGLNAMARDPRLAAAAGPPNGAQLFGPGPPSEGPRMAPPLLPPGAQWFGR